MGLFQIATVRRPQPRQHCTDCITMNSRAPTVANTACQAGARRRRFASTTPARSRFPVPTGRRPRCDPCRETPEAEAFRSATSRSTAPQGPDPREQGCRYRAACPHIKAMAYTPAATEKAGATRLFHASIFMPRFRRIGRPPPCGGRQCRRQTSCADQHQIVDESVPAHRRSRALIRSPRSVCP